MTVKDTGKLTKKITQMTLQLHNDRVLLSEIHTKEGCLDGSYERENVGRD